MKRVIAILGIIASIYILFQGIRDFDNAHNSIDVFKGLFWIVAGGFGFYGFIYDFKHNKWPF